MGSFTNSPPVKDHEDRIYLLEQAAGFEAIDITAKVDKLETFVNGNFLTFNTTTEALEDTGYNNASFVPLAGFVATEENYTTIEKAQLAALVANGGGGGYETHDKTNTNKSADFTKAVTAGSILLYVIVQRVSGTPVFKLGTEEGFDDIIPEFEMPEGTKALVQPLNEPYEAAATLYASITGGTVNVTFITYENILVV